MASYEARSRAMGWWSREWCCQGFRWAFESRRGRGLFVFASPPEPPLIRTYGFYLAFRSVEREYLDRMTPDPSAPPGMKICVSCSQGISYCPWCGQRLTRFYGRAAARLVDVELCREFQVPGWEQAVPSR